MFGGGDRIPVKTGIFVVDPKRCEASGMMRRIPPKIKIATIRTALPKDIPERGAKLYFPGLPIFFPKKFMSSLSTVFC